jgi:hypothetical protein
VVVDITIDFARLIGASQIVWSRAHSLVSGVRAS